MAVNLFFRKILRILVLIFILLLLFLWLCYLATVGDAVLRNSSIVFRDKVSLKIF